MKKKIYSIFRFLSRTTSGFGDDDDDKEEDHHKTRSVNSFHLSLNSSSWFCAISGRWSRMKMRNILVERNLEV